MYNAINLRWSIDTNKFAMKNVKAVDRKKRSNFVLKNNWIQWQIQTNAKLTTACGAHIKGGLKVQGKSPFLTERLHHARVVVSDGFLCWRLHEVILGVKLSGRRSQGPLTQLLNLRAFLRLCVRLESEKQTLRYERTLKALKSATNKSRFIQGPLWWLNHSHQTMLTLTATSTLVHLLVWTD